MISSLIFGSLSMSFSLKSLVKLFALFASVDNFILVCDCFVAGYNCLKTK